MSSWVVPDHDGEILKLDGIDSNGGPFPFDTTGAVTHNQPLYAPEYHGTSDINLKEDGVNFGEGNEGKIFIDPLAPFGAALVFKTDGVVIKQMQLRPAARMVIDVGLGINSYFEIRADQFVCKTQIDSRPWLELDWFSRIVKFGGDIHHYGELVFEFSTKYETGYVFQVDGENGTVKIKGDVEIDPEDSGNWPGAKVAISSQVAVVKSLSLGTLTISTVGPTDDLDISDVNTVFIDCSSNAVTIGGLVGGTLGQEIHFVRLCDTANNVTLEHNEGVNQPLLLHKGQDETLNGEYGGWEFICNGTSWFDISHAKHV